MPNYKPIQPKTRKDSSGRWYAFFEGEDPNPLSHTDEETALDALCNRTVQNFRCEKVSTTHDPEEEIKCLNRDIDKMRWCLNWNPLKRLSGGGAL